MESKGRGFRRLRIRIEEAGKYAGQSVTHAREHVLQDLNREGRLLQQKQIEHAVNVHERCGTPVEKRDDVDTKRRLWSGVFDYDLSGAAPNN